MTVPLLFPAPPLSATMESILMEVEQGFLSAKMGPVTGVAVSLAAACVVINLIGISKRFLNGSFDWWEFFRPIFIFLLVCNFSTLVLGPVRGLAGHFNTRLAATMGTSVDSFKEEFRLRTEEMCRQEFGPDDEGVETSEAEEGGGRLVRALKRIGSKITKSFYKINEGMNLGAAMIVSGVLFFLMNIFVSMTVILANMCLMMMAVIGPFTFALSIITPYASGIRLWIERYIQFTLWQPVLYIAMSLSTEVMVAGNQASTWGGFWAWCFMILAGFALIRAVPNFASMVIESAGTEALADRLNTFSSGALGKLGSMTRFFR